MTEQNQKIGPGGKGVQAGNIENLNLILQGVIEDRTDLSDPLPPVQFWQGRAEFGTVREALQAIAVVGVYGPGGAGKSTIAAQVFEGWRGPKLWVNLFAVPSFEDVARRGLQQLGGWSQERTQTVAEEALLEQLVAVLGQGTSEQRRLLVLDNFESVEPEEALTGKFGRLLQRRAMTGGEGRVLVTSRVRAELKASQMQWVSLAKGLDRESGRALLRSLGVLGTDGELGEFVDRAAGYPLVLTLAAGWLADERSDYRHVSLLPKEVFTIEGLHRGPGNISVEAILRKSYSLLTEDQQRLLQLVSVFRKPLLGQVFKAETHTTLKTLARRAFLLQKTNDHKQSIFDWQPVVKAFVQAQVTDISEALQMAARYYDNLYVDYGKWRTKQDIDNYIEKWNFYSELFIAQGNKGGEAVSLGALGLAYSALGDYQSAIKHQKLALTTYRGVGNRDGEATALRSLGVVYESLSDYPNAIQYQGESLKISREMGDRDGEGGCLCNLGLVYEALSQHRHAIEHYEQALIALRDVGNRRFEANTLNNLGMSWKSLDEYDKAIEHYEKSLIIRQEIGDRGGESSTLGNLGHVHSILGNYQRSLKYEEQSLDIKREIGDRAGEAKSLSRLGNICAHLNEYQCAINYYEQSLVITREIGNRQGEANSINDLGCAYSGLGKYRLAIEYYGKSLAIKREIGDRRGESNSLGNLGKEYRLLGDYRRAIEYSKHSLAICREIGYRRGQAIELNRLGLSWAKLGKKWEARENFIAARDLFAELGLDHIVKMVEQNLQGVLQIISDPNDIIRAPKIGADRHPESWELERFDQLSPHPKSRRKRRRKTQSTSWWRHLLRPLRHLIYQLFNP